MGVSRTLLYVYYAPMSAQPGLLLKNLSEKLNKRLKRFLHVRVTRSHFVFSQNHKIPSC